MPETFLLEVATPERLLVREQAREAQIPTAQGYIGVLPEHAPLLAELGTGLLTYTVGDRRSSIVVSGGFVEVEPDHVRVLAETAERPEEIDAERAREALRQAEKELLLAPPGSDIARALNQLRKAQERLAAAEKQKAQAARKT
jgi:F-type H+-transporting ATPase subunit epsilon